MVNQNYVRFYASERINFFYIVSFAFCNWVLRPTNILTILYLILSMLKMVSLHSVTLFFVSETNQNNKCYVKGQNQNRAVLIVLDFFCESWFWTIHVHLRLCLVWGRASWPRSCRQRDTASLGDCSGALVFQNSPTATNTCLFSFWTTCLNAAIRVTVTLKSFMHKHLLFTKLQNFSFIRT